MARSHRGQVNSLSALMMCVCVCVCAGTRAPACLPGCLHIVPACLCAFVPACLYPACSHACLRLPACLPACLMFVNELHAAYIYGNMAHV